MKPVIVAVLLLLVASINVKLPGVREASARALMRPPVAPTVNAPVPARLIRSALLPLRLKPSPPAAEAPPILRLASLARLTAPIAPSA